MQKTFTIILILLAMTAKAEVNFNKLVDAIYKSEGGDKTKHPYGIVSVKVKSKDHARQVCLATVKNNYKRWQKSGAKGDFIQYLQRIYCPVGAMNDPMGLNCNWSKNVNYFYRKI